jgi:ribose 1,5-bisphosphokinase PhnN
MNRKHTTFLLRLLLMALICVSVSGCAAVIIGGAAGAGAFAYTKGDREVVLDSSIDAVYDTAGQTLEALDINVVDSEKDALTARLTGRGAENKKITIKLKRIEENLTKMSVRVGIVGNKNMACVICDEITKNLQAAG